MTNDSGQIASYVEEVRAALGDLPAPERDDLLEDLPAHLSEVAAEDSTTPLRERLGPPAAYAAELRAALQPAPGGARRSAGERWAVRWERLRHWLAALDLRAGRLVGYERLSEFGRLLVPAWWVLRGYLAAMLVVTLLDNRPPAAGEMGLLPRLGGSTLAGWVILAAFVVGSVWLARCQPRLSRWPRRVLFAVSAYLVLFGVNTYMTVDDNQRWGYVGPNAQYVSVNPYEGVQDVFPDLEE